MIPPYCRKRRGTKEPLDESEREEWKSWLKTQHPKHKDHGIWSHHFMGNWWGNSGNSDRLYLLRLQSHCRWWLQPWNWKTLPLRRKAMTKLDSILKSRDITLWKKGPYSQSYNFSSGHISMWELDHKKRLSAEELVLSNCVGEDSWEPLGQQRGKSVNP